MFKNRFSSVFICCLALLFLAIACNESPQKDGGKEQQYSSTQQYLFRLLDDYKTDYFATPKPEREQVRQKYLAQMENFLTDSLGRYIDSMTVIVDAVIQEDWLVTTRFHSGDIAFQYGMKFQDSMAPALDSLYRVMIGFSPGKEITVDLVHVGGAELNYPDDKSKRTMRIFAYPTPLK